MRVKICGITQAQQGKEIAALGATALGFICVERSPRCVTPAQIRAIVNILPNNIDKVGVFANEALKTIVQTVSDANLTAIQLHGAESPEFCRQLKQVVAPEIELIKAFRIQTARSLAETAAYNDCVDTLLLDAYHPQMLGGTGETLNWNELQEFKPNLPWLLAGGLNPDNIITALAQLQPDGIDLSSGVERSPGDKDLVKVAKLFKLITANCSDLKLSES